MAIFFPDKFQYNVIKWTNEKYLLFRMKTAGIEQHEKFRESSETWMKKCCRHIMPFMVIFEILFVTCLYFRKISRFFFLPNEINVAHNCVEHSAWRLYFFLHFHFLHHTDFVFFSLCGMIRDWWIDIDIYNSVALWNGHDEE